MNGTMGSMNAGGGQPGGGAPGMPDMSSMPDMESMPEGFTMPEGMSPPEGFTMPEGMNFPGGGNPSGSGSGETQTAEIAEADGTAEAADGTAVQSQPPERPSGMPEGMSFPGGQQADRSGGWIWTAVCGAVLLAALLIVRRTGVHNQ